MGTGFCLKLVFFDKVCYILCYFLSCQLADVCDTVSALLYKTIHVQIIYVEGSQ